MKTKGIFIAGTDTDVGKTLVTGLFAKFLSARGIRTVTQKWVQTGTSCGKSDVSCHLDIMGAPPEEVEKYFEYMTPYSFRFPSSPHLASKIEKIAIDPGRIKTALLRLSEDFDMVLAEGSGGLMVPINENVLMVDIVRDLSLPVILVVENRLGAINQAVLSAEALKNRDIPVIGMIFNRLSRTEEETILEDNKEIITAISGVRSLGEIPYIRDLLRLDEVFLPIGSEILKAITNNQQLTK
jgi:dethiobiotin synthetase